MILSIILLIIIILIVTILLMFLFYILLPSIQKQNKKKFTDDVIISESEIKYIEPVKAPNEKSNMKALVLCSCSKEFDMSSTGYYRFLTFTNNFTALSQIKGTAIFKAPEIVELYANA